MAFLGAHDATVAGRQAFETGVTVALAETFSGGTITVDTANSAVKINLDGMPDEIIEWHAGIADFQGVGNRGAGLGGHFGQAAGDIK
jgi:hypothetical protein